MVARAVTVAFDGVDARRVDVEVQLVGASQPSFTLVGLPDKAVAESRERVRGAFAGIGLALPPKRIIASLAPADLPKEGSHFDLPIALALLAAMGWCRWTRWTAGVRSANWVWAARFRPWAGPCRRR